MFGVSEAVYEIGDGAREQFEFLSGKTGSGRGDEGLSFKTSCTVTGVLDEAQVGEVVNYFKAEAGPFIRSLDEAWDEKWSDSQDLAQEVSEWIDQSQGTTTVTGNVEIDYWQGPWNVEIRGQTEYEADGRQGVAVLYYCPATAPSEIDGIGIYISER